MFSPTLLRLQIKNMRAQSHTGGEGIKTLLLVCGGIDAGLTWKAADGSCESWKAELETSKCRL